MNNIKLIQTHKKLTLLFTLMVFVVVFVFGIGVISAKYYSEQRTQKRDFEISTQSILQKIARGEKLPSLSSRQRARLQDVFGKNLHGGQVSFFILDRENNIVFDHIIESPEFEHIVLDQGNVFYTDDETMVRVATLPKNTLGEKVVFFKEHRYSDTDFIYDIAWFVVLSIVLAVFLYLIGYRFVGRTLTPVKENLQDMSDFIHNAGHELKTPLAVMRGNLQVMQAEKTLDTQLVQKSISEIDNLSQLIEGLRELSELGKFTEKQEIQLTTEVQKVVDEFSAYAEKNDIRLDVRLRGSYILQANRYELHVLLSNLIKNAISYNTSGGKVSISLIKNICVISDTGVGIPKREQEKIFERFYRSSNIRSEEGFGIGLSLVKKITDVNNWKLEMESIEGKGTKFKIIF